ncbi:MAG: aspartate aminotransferase family protein [Bacteroidota bacterium]
MKTHKTLQEKGFSAIDLSKKLQGLKSGDAKWDMGKVFGFVYHPGNHYAKVSHEYLNAFLHENTLNPSTFPSLKTFENEIIRMASELMHGDSQVAGNITSGGSESIFLALKVARDWTKEALPETTTGEIIIPETAHPAFHKSCHYLGLKAIIIPVGEDKRADVEAMEKAITERTVLLVGSAPCFPYGVVDPIADIARVAKRHGLLCHVDACMGGFMLPFVEELGYPVPPFDFRVSGVTSISLDAHKYGYAPKGVSILLHKNRELRKKQFYVYTDWSGGIYASTTFMGTKSGGPLAGCWAVMKHMGREGYRTIADQVMKTTGRIKEGIEKHEHLHVLGKPDMSVLAFTSDRGDIYNIGDALSAKGWHLDRLQFPDALHITVNQLNIGKEIAFLKDLDEIMADEALLEREYRTTMNSVKLAKTLTGLLPDKWIEKLSRKAGAKIESGGSGKKAQQAALYGISATFENRKNVSKLVENLLDGMYS